LQLARLNHFLAIIYCNIDSGVCRYAVEFIAADV